MANSATQYIGNGTTTAFSIGLTLSYLRESHIKVFLDEVETTDFSLINADSKGKFQSVQLLTAPAQDVVVLVRRITQTTLIHDYQDGALILEEHLDESNLQALMLAEEAQDGFFDEGRASDLNMGGNRLTSLMAGEAGSDGVNVLQLEQAIAAVAAGDDIFVPGATLSITYTSQLLSEANSPEAFESNYYDNREIRGSGAKWIKDGTTGTPGTTDFSTGHIYNANGVGYIYDVKGNCYNMLHFGIDNTPSGIDTLNNLIAVDVLASAPEGSKIIWPTGFYRLTEIVHPQKLLNWYGNGKSKGGNLPASPEVSGTILQFSGDNTLHYKTDGVSTNAESQLNNMTIWGDGTTDDNGTNTLLKINNGGGVDLNHVDVRYGRITIEVNTAVTMKWNDVTPTGSFRGILFIYDPSDSSAEFQKYSSFCTESVFTGVSPHSSKVNPDAVGLYVDATCHFGGNTWTGTDIESNYTGAVIEGKVASKEYTDPDNVFHGAFGASAWQGTGNTFIQTWFERNTGQNIEFVSSVDESFPRIQWKGVYQDVNKVTGVFPSMVETSDGLQYLVHDPDEPAKGKIGTWGTPLTAGQTLLSGPEVNSPLTRTILSEKVAYSANNRTSVNVISGYDFNFNTSALTQGVDVNVCDVDLIGATKSSIVKVSLVGTTSDNNQAYFDGVYVVQNTAGTISITELRKDEGTAGYVQPIFTDMGDNIFRLSINTTRAINSTRHTTGSVSLLMGGDNGGEFTSTLTILI